MAEPRSPHFCVLDLKQDQITENQESDRSQIAPNRPQGWQGIRQGKQGHARAQIRERQPRGRGDMEPSVTDDGRKRAGGKNR